MENSYQVLVIDAYSQALLIVNGTSGEILTEMPYTDNFTPTELAVTTDFSKAYLPAVGKDGKGALFASNLKNKCLYQLPLDIPQPTQFTLSPNNINAYFTNPDGMLFALDIPSLSITSWGKPEKSACVGLAADNNAIYSVWEYGSSGSLAIFDYGGNLIFEHALPGIPTNIILDTYQHILIPFTTTTFSSEGIIIFNSSCPMAPPAVITSNPALHNENAPHHLLYPCHAITLHDGNTAYTVNEESSSLTVINIPTATVSHHIPLERSISCLHLLPDGQTALASSHIFTDLSLINLLTGKILATTDTTRELLGYIAVIPAL